MSYRDTICQMNLSIQNDLIYRAARPKRLANVLIQPRCYIRQEMVWLD